MCNPAPCNHSRPVLAAFVFIAVVGIMCVVWWRFWTAHTENAAVNTPAVSHVLLNAAADVVACEGTACKVLGLSHDKMIGKSLTQYMPPTKSSEFMRRFDAGVHNGFHYWRPFDVPMMTKDGAIRTVTIMMATSVESEDGLYRGKLVVR